MALIKEYITPKGTVSYWLVSLIQIDNFSKTAYARLYGFGNKQHADMENPTPIITLEVNITPDIYDYYFNKEIMVMESVTPQTQAYQIFKDFNIEDGQGIVFNFKNAVDEVSN